MHRDDVLGVRGVVLDLLAELGDVHVHGAGEGDGVVVPDGVEELLAGDDLAAVLDEVGEELELAGRDVDRLAAFLGLVALEVDR